MSTVLVRIQLLRVSFQSARTQDLDACRFRLSTRHPSSRGFVPKASQRVIEIYFLKDFVRKVRRRVIPIRFFQDFVWKLRRIIVSIKLCRIASAKRRSGI